MFAQKLLGRVIELEKQNQNDPSQANLEEDPELAVLKSQLENRPEAFYKDYDSNDNKVDKRVKMNDLVQMCQDFRQHKVVSSLEGLKSKVDRLMERIGGIDNLAQLHNTDSVRLNTRINKMSRHYDGQFDRLW